MSRYVKIYYGPCEEFFTLSHKPPKIRGLKDQLLKLGYRVDCIPVKHINYLMIEMCGNEVFRCNIKNLGFNIPHSIDPICQRAVTAVEDASIKLERANTYFWLQFLIQDLVFKRSELAPSEKWVFELNLKPVATCLECKKCRGHFVKENGNK